MSKKSIRPAVYLVCLFATTLACNIPGVSAPVSPGVKATGLALTAAAILTNAAATGAPFSVTLEGGGSLYLTPTPTPPPALLPTASPTECTRASKFLEDVTVPDNTHFAPGTTFVKTWRLRNTGTCTWDSTYEFRFIGGELMGGTNVKLIAPVPPNATVDISVTFTAPAAAGTYTSRWQLHGPDGAPFGQKPYVRIIVP